MRVECTMTLEKECKHSVRYKPTTSVSARPVESIYLLRAVLPEGRPPATLKMVIEIPTRA